MTNENENNQPSKLIVDDTSYETTYTEKYKRRKQYEPENPKHIKAFIPGVVKSINVHLGQHIKEGDMLLILEAMKMENRLLAPVSGTIKDILVEKEQMVPKHHLLIVLE